MKNIKPRPSGCQNKKRKLEREEAKTREIAKCRKLTIFFKPISSSSQNDLSEILNDDDQNEEHGIVVPQSSSSSSLVEPQPISSSSHVEPQPSSSSSHVEPATSSSEYIISAISNETELSETSYTIPDDVALWPKNPNQEFIDRASKIGPKRPPSNFIFPLNKETNRKFSWSHYTTIVIKNGKKETIDREWVLYSVRDDIVFCFPCKLFAINSKCVTLTKTGNSDWRNISTTLKEHEGSPGHIKAVLKWHENRSRTSKFSGVDSQHQKACETEKQKWKDILERVVEAIKFLASRNLAFRGHTEKLGCQSNGNFLGLLELIAKFDTVMSNHLENIQSSDRRMVHYLSKDTQNEFIQIISMEVLSTIVEEIKLAKYFAIILDCTPDISHTEQMSVVLRYFKIRNNTVEVKECFVGYTAVHETTGLGLTESIIKFLKKIGLSLDNVRGQSYDNGANMKGKYSGVQARILELNNRAFFVSCITHTLNLILGDIGDCNPNCITLFGILQKLYTFSSSSTKRWEVMNDYLVSLKLKSLCTTRWESRLDCLKTIHTEIANVRDGLKAISESTRFEADVRFDARNMAGQLENYPFLVILCIFFDILTQINIVSKKLQAESIDVGSALKLINTTALFLKNYRDTGFAKAQLSAKELGRQLGMKKSLLCFPSTRSTRTSSKCHKTAESEFRVNTFNSILDMAITKMNDRFEETKTTLKNFQVFYDGEFRNKLSDKDLLSHCNKIEELLTDRKGIDSDVSGWKLYNNFQSLKNSFPDASGLSAMNLLKFIVENGNENLFPDLCTALQIVLVIPSTVASCERSFSKLKLIKTYLRSTMLQDRLTGLALLSIENDTTNSVEFQTIIDAFASVKARKKVI